MADIDTKVERVDLFVRISFAVAVVALLFGLAAFIQTQRHENKPPKPDPRVAILDRQMTGVRAIISCFGTVEAAPGALVVVIKPGCSS